jgi:hypothetical protein
MSSSTKEILQEKIAVLREFLQENYNIDISHEASVDILSKILNCKSSEKSPLPISIKTVADMKKAIERFEDSALLDASYTFPPKELDCDELNSDEIYQEFSLLLEDDSAKDIASFKLQLVDQSMTKYF